MTETLKAGTRLTRDQVLETLRAKYENDLNISIHARDWHDHLIETADAGQREMAKELPPEDTAIGRSRLKMERATACESLSRAAYTNELHRGSIQMYDRIIVRSQRADEGPTPKSARILARNNRMSLEELNKCFGIKITH